MLEGARFPSKYDLPVYSNTSYPSVETTAASMETSSGHTEDDTVSSLGVNGLGSRESSITTVEDLAEPTPSAIEGNQPGGGDPAEPMTTVMDVDKSVGDAKVSDALENHETHDA